MLIKENKDQKRQSVFSIDVCIHQLIVCLEPGRDMMPHITVWKMEQPEVLKIDKATKHLCKCRVKLLQIFPIHIVNICTRYQSQASEIDELRNAVIALMQSEDCL